MKSGVVKYIFLGALSLIVPFVLLAILIWPPESMKQSDNPSDIKDRLIQIQQSNDKQLLVLQRQMDMLEELLNRPSTEDQTIHVKIANPVTTQPPKTETIITSASNPAVPHASASVVSVYFEQIKELILCDICKDELIKKKFEEECNEFTKLKRESKLLEHSITKLEPSKVDGSDYSELKEDVLIKLNELKFYYDLITQGVSRPVTNSSDCNNCDAMEDSLQKVCTSCCSFISEIKKTIDPAVKFEIITHIKLDNIHGLSGIDYIGGDWMQGAKFIVVGDQINSMGSKIYELTFQVKDKLITLLRSSSSKPMDHLNGEAIRRIENKDYLVSEMDGQHPQIFIDEDKKPFYIQDDWSIQNNTGFESLTTDGLYLYTAIERARDKKQTKIYKLNFEGDVEAIYNYFLEDLILNGGDGTGITELLFWKEKNFFVLEREWGKEIGTVIKLKLTKLEDNLSVYGSEVFDLGELINQYQRGLKIDNFEGMSWGPDLDGYQRTMVLVSDDNGKGGKDNSLQNTWIVLLGIPQD